MGRLWELVCRTWGGLFESTADTGARRSQSYVTRRFTARESGRTQRYPSPGLARSAGSSPPSPDPAESAIMQEIRELASMPRVWAGANAPPAAAGAEGGGAPAEPWPQGALEEAEPLPSEPGTLSPDILHYFASLDLTPIVGVSDPLLKEKLATPTLYGWQPRPHVFTTFRSVTDPHLSAMHHFRLTPRDGTALGQMVMLSEDGDLFLETAGPWGRTWMHRSPGGEITCRELRTAPVPDRLHFRKTA